MKFVFFIIQLNFVSIIIQTHEIDDEIESFKKLYPFLEDNTRNSSFNYLIKKCDNNKNVCFSKQILESISFASSITKNVELKHKKKKRSIISAIGSSLLGGKGTVGDMVSSFVDKVASATTTPASDYAQVKKLLIFELHSNSSIFFFV